MENSLTIPTENAVPKDQNSYMVAIKREPSSEMEFPKGNLLLGNTLLTALFGNKSITQNIQIEADCLKEVKKETKSKEYSSKEQILHLPRKLALPSINPSITQKNP